MKNENVTGSCIEVVSFLFLHGCLFLRDAILAPIWLISAGATVCGGPPTEHTGALCKSSLRFMTY